MQLRVILENYIGLEKLNNKREIKVEKLVNLELVEYFFLLLFQKNKHFFIVDSLQNDFREKIFFYNFLLNNKTFNCMG